MPFEKLAEEKIECIYLTASLLILGEHDPPWPKSQGKISLSSFLSFPHQPTFSGHLFLSAFLLGIGNMRKKQNYSLSPTTD